MCQHKNYLDKYCYKCNIQFCSKCEIYKEHSSHGFKSIKKIITKEKIEKIKSIVNDDKNYLKKYIFDFIKEHMNKFPKNKHLYITNSLIKPYINSMKIFFHFCDNILLNYDVEYPNYYQQYNLNKFLPFFTEKTFLRDLNEKKLERIFKYINGNFLSQKKEENLLTKDCLSFSNNYILNSLVIDNEIIVLVFEDKINEIKIYNYKTNNLISTIDTKFPDLENQYSGNLLLKQINKDIFAII